ncbi:hypothetical protein SAMN04490193_3093 [Pseudomonas marginalis]|nr:hypothetical protein SAMN04490193_3093 [Pseudomonas marginalis]
MTVDQLINLLADTPLSGASPLPQLSCLHPADFGRMGGSQKSRVGSRHGLTHLGLNVGGGLLPMTLDQLINLLADTPLSGASPLPQLSCLHPADFGRMGGSQKSRVGSRHGLTRLGLNVGGGLLPMTVDQLMNQLTDTPLSGASPLPQLSCLHPADFGRMGGSQKSRVGSRHGLTHLGLNVGGGLLPMTVDQLINLLADTPLSGASPLPQLSCLHPADFSRMVGCQKLLVGSRRELTHLGLNVGGGLLPMTVDQLINLLADTPLSGASPLPQLSCLHPADFGRMGDCQKVITALCCNPAA